MRKLFTLLSNQYFWLGIIILLGFWVRLYKLDLPIADWHSWRQADTAAVTRNFIKEGFNPFLPRYDDMSGVAEKPIVNPARFRFVEFPFYNMVVYPLYLLFGVNETYHRLVSIIFSLGSIVFLYLITRKYTNIITAYITAFTFAFLPFNVFFSRTTLPEPTFVFFALGMIYFVDRWIWENNFFWIIAGFIFTTLAFLIKPWAIFFYIPLFYSVLRKGDTNKFIVKFIFFTIISILPLICWRLWILQQPEGIPASGWLLDGDGIRFRPAFWWWIISERMGGEILGITGLVLFFVGLIVRPKNGYFLHFWALSSFLFMIVFATGNVRHNYYQILFIPIASIFLAKGLTHLFKGDNLYIARIWTMLLAILFFPLTFYFSWKVVGGFYQINNPVIVEAGKIADQILPQNAVVLVPYNGDTAFLYQTNRAGFAFVPSSIKDLIADYGINYYISTSYDVKTKWVLRYFYPVVQNPQFVVVDLTHLKKNFENGDPEP